MQPEHTNKFTNLDKPFLITIQNTKVNPVFILGHHRSGTSILYKILIATKTFNPVTAYHLIYYNQLLYNKEHSLEENAKTDLTNLLKKSQKDRGIDKLKITADFAEEYGFLLGQKTIEMNISKNNLGRFLEMTKKIQYISKNKKPLLLKNPYDFSHFLFIKEKIPNAKFIFIHRHPAKTLSSSIKAIRYLLKEKSLYTTMLYRLYNTIYAHPPILFFVRLLTNKLSLFGSMVLSLRMSKEVRYYLKNIEKLSKKDYQEITYEHLCDKPQETIETILTSFNLKAQEKIDYNSYIKPRKTTLDLSVKQLQKFSYAVMKKYYHNFNYQP